MVSALTPSRRPWAKLGLMRGLVPLKVGSTCGPFTSLTSSPTKSTTKSPRRPHVVVLPAMLCLLVSPYEGTPLTPGEGPYLMFP